MCLGWIARLQQRHTIRCTAAGGALQQHSLMQQCLLAEGGWRRTTVATVEHYPEVAAGHEPSKLETQSRRTEHNLECLGPDGRTRGCANPEGHTNVKWYHVAEKGAFDGSFSECFPLDDRRAVAHFLSAPRGRQAWNTSKPNALVCAVTCVMVHHCKGMICKSNNACVDAHNERTPQA